MNTGGDFLFVAIPNMLNLGLVLRINLKEVLAKSLKSCPLVIVLKSINGSLEGRPVFGF